MTQIPNLTSHSLRSLRIRMFSGAAIGLLLISFFIFSSGEPNPEWGKLWMIRPLLIVPLAGAMGGLSNYIIMQFQADFRINKIVAWILSALTFLVGLWLGVILGLNGTLWN